MRLLRIVALAGAFVSAVPAVVHAQIYAWRDPAGNLVLSDQRKDPGALTYAVSGATGIRTTRAARGSRSVIYEDLIQEHASRHAISADLVRAVIQAESGFNPYATSIKGAMGLMQLMPATATRYGVANPYDPEQNIGAGVAYLRSLLDRYNDDETLALAAYNAGPTSVEKYGRQVPPYRETRNYVLRIRNATAGTRPVARLFKTVEVVDGREVVRYSNKPSAGAEPVKPAEWK